ncbi:DnaJ domain-containing protein [Rufibacter quisquiliarum]
MLAESYRVLQLPYGAQMPQIRQAYRQLVLQYHPDRNRQPGAYEVFLQVQAAYEYLQKYHTVGVAAPAFPPAPQTAATKAERDWEKYRHLYEPPADPREFAAWAEVARERVRRQKEKDHAAYVQRTLEMKKQWWYGIALASSYALLLAGSLTGIVIAIIPFLFLLSDHPKRVFLAVILVPVGWRIVNIMQNFRQDIRRHFGEDLPEE